MMKKYNKPEINLLSLMSDSSLAAFDGFESLGSFGVENIESYTMNSAALGIKRK